MSRSARNGFPTASSHCWLCESGERRNPACAELPAALKKKVGRHDNLPALLLGRMAVDSRHKGKGLGVFMLKFALKTGCEISESSGCFAVLVDAKDEASQAFLREVRVPTAR
jgi:hypothetical protein